MSSYNQVTEECTLAVTLGLATNEIMMLYEEMADLCAHIAGQFPSTYEDIPKYQQAYHALTSLDEARTVLKDEPLDRIDPAERSLAVAVTVGKQTKRRQAMSQRVRLGNAVVRLRGVKDTLPSEDSLATDLFEMIRELADVVFPQRYG